MQRVKRAMRGISESECRAYLQLCQYLIKEQSRDAFELTWKTVDFLNSHSNLHFNLAHHLGLVEKFTLGGHRDHMMRSYSNGQVESKLWLVSNLRNVLPRAKYQFVIVGGWTGLLSNILLWMAPEWVSGIVQVDRDEEAQWIAKQFLIDAHDEGVFRQATSDIKDFSFRGHHQVIVNCSCEHFENPKWFERVPQDCVAVLQSTNFKDEPTHLDCVENMAEFREKYPLEVTLFGGQIDLGLYRRFMRIGRV